MEMEAERERGVEEAFNGTKQTFTYRTQVLWPMANGKDC